MFKKLWQYLFGKPKEKVWVVFWINYLPYQVGADPKTNNWSIHFNHQDAEDAYEELVRNPLTYMAGYARIIEGTDWYT